MADKPITIDRVKPGAFYQSVYPGGFTDALTGVHIPGPVVNIDEVTRGVKDVAHMPDPIQLPHLKLSFNAKDPTSTEKVEVPFDRMDAEATCEALNMALATGIIQEVSLEDVKRYYPNAYANRRDRIVLNLERNAVVMADLVRDFQEQQHKATAGVAARRSEADESLNTKRRGRPPATKEPVAAAVGETEAAE